jgi:hypothetical protein
MARKELRASTEETRECVTRMLRKKVKTMRSEEDGIYVEGFLPFSLMEEVVELLRTDKKFQRITGVARIQVKDLSDMTEEEAIAYIDSLGAFGYNTSALRNEYKRTKTITI